MSLFGKSRAVDVGPGVEKEKNWREECDRLTLKLAEQRLKHEHELQKKDLVYAKRIADLETEITIMKETKDIAIEKAVNKVRKDLEQACFESDLSRTAAEAKLEAYQETDRKDERKQLHSYFQTTLESLREAVKTQPVINVSNSSE